MPRDSNNIYTLPEAPFQPNTVAQPAPVNNNFSDIGTALTNSFTRAETTAFTRTLLDDTDAAAARATLEATATGGAVFTAASAAAARATLGVAWAKLSQTTAANVLTAEVKMPAGFRRYRLTIENGRVHTANNYLLCQFSSDDGASWLTASNYQGRNTNLLSNGTSVISTGAANFGIGLTDFMPNSGANLWDATFEVYPGSVSQPAYVRGSGVGLNNGGLWNSWTGGGEWVGPAARMNSMLIFGSGTSNISGTYIMEGLA